MVGNGGDSGGVNFGDMWAPLTTCASSSPFLDSPSSSANSQGSPTDHMAVASTDTGHRGALAVLLLVVRARTSFPR